MAKPINSLWRPPADMPKPRKVVPRARYTEEEEPLPLVDEICQTAKCAHVGKCDGPCCWLSYVNGKSPMKELPIGDDMEGRDYADYNAVLAERIISTREIHGEIINGISDLRKRAIVILIDEGFLLPDLARIMHCSERTIYRIKGEK